MKKILLPFMLAFIFILPACTAMPQEVKEDMKEYNSNTKIEGNNGIEYDSVENIVKNLDLYKEVKYQNLILPENITIENINSIPIITFKQFKNFEENYNNVFKEFFDKDIINHQKIEAISVLDNNGYTFNNEREKMYGAVANNGLITILKPEAYDLLFQNSADIENLIHVDRKENTDISYKLSDGDYYISDAVDFVENWLGEHINKYNNYYTYKVKTVIVRKISEDKCYFEIDVESVYNGIPLDEISNVFIAENEDKSSYFKYTCSNIKIQIMSKDTIASFTNGVGFISVDEIDTSNSKFITLPSALKLVESKLSGFKNIHISDIEIKYILLPQYNHETQNIASPGMTITSRPVWAFIIDVDEKEYADNYVMTSYGNLRKYVYVDMITGEITVHMDYMKR